MTPIQSEQKAQDFLLKVIQIYAAQHSLEGLIEQVDLLIQKSEALDWLEEHHKGHRVNHSVQKGWRIWNNHLTIVKDEPTLLSAISKIRKKQK